VRTTNQQVWEQRRAEASAREAQQRQAVHAEVTRHREQIDANFVRTLKDPDSRKIAYQGNPYGSLVCSTVNARNSYGGYTGQQLFAAYFRPAGTVAEVLVFDPQVIRDLQKLRQANWPVSAEVVLLDRPYIDCGGKFGS
jgi:hypothetical protein